MGVIRWNLVSVNEMVSVFILLCSLLAYKFIAKLQFASQIYISFYTVLFYLLSEAPLGPVNSLFRKISYLLCFVKSLIFWASSVLFT